MFDIPFNLFKPSTQPSQSLSTRFVSWLVDMFFIASVVYALFGFPYGAVHEWWYRDEYLLRGTGVVSRGHVVSVDDRGVGGVCDFRKTNMADYMKECHPRRKKDVVID